MTETMWPIVGMVAQSPSQPAVSASAVLRSGDSEENGQLTSATSGSGIHNDIRREFVPTWMCSQAFGNTGTICPKVAGRFVPCQLP
jgi:hypothetical protein